MLTDESDRHQCESHDTSTSVCCAESISKAPLSTEGHPIVGVGSNGHTDGTACNGGNGSDNKGEGCVSLLELLHGSIDDEEHDANKNDADQVLLFKELLGTLR
jgi:hypothetical protein